MALLPNWLVRLSANHFGIEPAVANVKVAIVVLSCRDLRSEFPNVKDSTPATACGEWSTSSPELLLS